MADDRLTAIGVDRLCVSLDGVAPLFEPVDVEIPDGAFVAVVGPSGVGKSSLLRSLVGLQSFRAIGLTVLGNDMLGASNVDWTTLRRQSVRYVDQNCSLIDELNVRQNVAVSALNREDEGAAVDELLARFELQHRSASVPAHLSGGERQRVALARALVTDPKIVVCDEPTAFLDRSRTRAVCELLRGEADRGRSVVVATHDPLVVDFADASLTISEPR